jgi:hypothetical protein
LTEGSDTLSVIYGATGDDGLTATLSGIQQDLNVFTSFSCDEAVLTSGLRVNYIPNSCGSPHADPDGDSYGHSHGHGDASGNANGYSHSHGCGNRYADSYCGTAAWNSDTATAADTGASPVGCSGSEKMIID